MRLNWMDPENGSLFLVFVFTVVSLKKIRLNGRLQVVVSSIFFSLFFPSFPPLYSLPPPLFLSFFFIYFFLLSFFLKIKCVLRYFSGSEWAVKMMGNIMVTIWIFFFTFRMLDVLVEQGLVFMCSEAMGAKNIITEASTVGGKIVFEFCYIYAIIFYSWFQKGLFCFKLQNVVQNAKLVKQQPEWIVHFKIHDIFSPLTLFMFPTCFL